MSSPDDQMGDYEDIRTPPKGHLLALALSCWALALLCWAWWPR